MLIRNCCMPTCRHRQCIHARSAQTCACMDACMPACNLTSFSDGRCRMTCHDVNELNVRFNVFEKECICMADPQMLKEVFHVQLNAFRKDVDFAYRCALLSTHTYCSMPVLVYRAYPCVAHMYVGL
jgi:hypothetical protein